MNAPFPTLDRAAGFDLSFDVTVDAESHASADRAGFSLILLGSDKRGVELGLWAGQVWAQSNAPQFTHAAGSTGFDPTDGFHAYGLAVAGGTFTPSADGTTILTGTTRDYSAAGMLPYTPGDYQFLGDDTAAAAGPVIGTRAAGLIGTPVTGYPGRGHRHPKLSIRRSLRSPGPPHGLSSGQTLSRSESA